MFTGIVEEIGRISAIEKNEKHYVLSVAAQKTIANFVPGGSIAVNGVCLTATDVSDTSFTADVMPETLRATNLGMLKCGDCVNLERALTARGRFDGHLVTGHVDGRGTIRSITPEKNAVKLEIEAEEEILFYLVEKGSIAVDGTSLTVFRLTSNSFFVSLIPHTYSNTIFSSKKVGDVVNLEVDMIAKYVKKWLAPHWKEMLKND